MSNFHCVSSVQFRCKLFSGKEYAGRYLAPKHRGTEFSVMHYAGKVTYSVDGVLEKNRDTLPTSIMFTMKSKSNYCKLSFC